MRYAAQRFRSTRSGWGAGALPAITGLLLVSPLVVLAAPVEARLVKIVARWLENRITRPALPSGAHVDGIIVLGGASSRVRAALALAERFQDAPIVLSGPGDGEIINAIILPTDTLVNLACEDVGIFTEQCVLEDPENPFVTVPIIEFDVNDPDATNKFELFNSIPKGRTGAKARYYFWATALARRASGENQFYTALALHELWNYNGDPIIQAQALKAYRSVLDNFFGSVTVFTCCEDVRPPDDPRGPLPPRPMGDPHGIRNSRGGRAGRPFA